MYLTIYYSYYNVVKIESEEAMKEYKVEMEALILVDVEAKNKKEALHKVKKHKLHWGTQDIYKNNEGGIKANYHYEECDFNRAKVFQQ